MRLVCLECPAPAVGGGDYCAQHERARRGLPPEPEPAMLPPAPEPEPASAFCSSTARAMVDNVALSCELDAGHSAKHHTCGAYVWIDDIVPWLYGTGSHAAEMRERGEVPPYEPTPGVPDPDPAAVQAKLDHMDRIRARARAEALALLPKCPYCRARVPDPYTLDGREFCKSSCAAEFYRAGGGGVSTDTAAKAGKTPFDLVDFDFVGAMSRQLDSGLRKAGRVPNDWRQLDPGEYLPEYRSALLRHLAVAKAQLGAVDPESGEAHYVAVAVNAMICAHFERALTLPRVLSTADVVGAIAERFGLTTEAAVELALGLARKLEAERTVERFGPPGLDAPLDADKALEGVYAEEHVGPFDADDARLAARLARARLADRRARELLAKAPRAHIDLDTEPSAGAASPSKPEPDEDTPA